MMLDDLIKTNNVPLNEDDLNFIKDLIRGEPRLWFVHIVRPWT